MPTQRDSAQTEYHEDSKTSGSERENLEILHREVFRTHKFGRPSDLPNPSKGQLPESSFAD